MKAVSGVASKAWRAVKERHRLSLVEQPVVFGPRDRLTCGSGVRLANALINTHGGTVSIGDLTFMGHDVLLLTGTHKFAVRGRGRQVTAEARDHDIRIGRGVWIASRCVIIGPCSIGDDSVIASGCIIDFDVESGKIVRPDLVHRVEDIRFK